MIENSSKVTALERDLRNALALQDSFIKRINELEEQLASAKFALRQRQTATAITKLSALKLPTTTLEVLLLLYSTSNWIHVGPALTEFHAQFNRHISEDSFRLAVYKLRAAYGQSIVSNSREFGYLISPEGVNLVTKTIAEWDAAQSSV